MTALTTVYWTIQSRVKLAVMFMGTGSIIPKVIRGDDVLAWPDGNFKQPGHGWWRYLPSWATIYRDLNIIKLNSSFDMEIIFNLIWQPPNNSQSGHISAWWFCCLTCSLIDLWPKWSITEWMVGQMDFWHVRNFGRLSWDNFLHHESQSDFLQFIASHLLERVCTHVPIFVFGMELNFIGSRQLTKLEHGTGDSNGL